MSENQERKVAIALRYQAEKDVSPKVIGKGKGILAKEIIDLAEENQIPIQEDPALVEMLSQLEVNQTIPSELYEVVAEVFAFLYTLDRNGK
jgi:flagellar biosynthesis protein